MSAIAGFACAPVRTVTPGAGGSGAGGMGGSGSGGDNAGGSDNVGGSGSGGDNSGGVGAGGDSAGGAGAGGDNSSGGADGDNSGGGGSGGTSVGGSGGDSSPSDAPIGSCSTATANPCNSIPKFTGTQTVDGKGDDFCQVPSFQFDVTNAAKVNNYNNVPLSQFETVTGQVAWSSAGFSAFFDVKDASVQTVNMADPSQAISKTYEGDSIEIMISSNNNVTGLTGTDNNTLQVIIPANGPAISTKASNSGGASSGTPTALPSNQYAQATTDTGYAIEVQLPWPGGAPSAGSQIRFDLSLNSADKIFGTVDDMRDGQLLYYVGTVNGGTTCQSSEGTVPFCDDRTWCTTSVQ